MRRVLITLAVVTSLVGCADGMTMPPGAETAGSGIGSTPGSVVSDTLRGLADRVREMDVRITTQTAEDLICGAARAAGNYSACRRARDVDAFGRAIDRAANRWPETEEN